MSKYPQLDEYVKQSRAQGFSDEDLKKQILATGYTQEDIDEVFGQSLNPTSSVSNQNQIVSDSNTQDVPIQSSETVIRVNVDKFQSTEKDYSVSSTPVATGAVIMQKPAMDVQNIQTQDMTQTVHTTVPVVKTLSSDVKQMTQQNISPSQNQPMSEVHPKSHLVSKTLITLLILIIVGGGGYIYAFQRDLITNLFFRAPYSEENFLTGIFSKLNTIESANYIFSAKLYMEDREPGRTSLPGLEGVAMLEEKYQRDAERFKIHDIIRREAQDWDTGLYVDLNIEELKKVMEDFNVKNVSLSEDIISSYKKINGGKGYEIKITFETDEAIKALKEETEISSDQSSYESTYQFMYDQKTVTIINPEGDYFYIFLPSRVPKTLAQEIVFSVSDLSPDFKSDAQVDIKGEDTDNGLDLLLKVGLNADLGDMTFKISADFIRKQKQMFLRLNNFPSIVSAFFPVPKSEWIKLSAEESLSFLGNATDVSEDVDALSTYQKNLKEIFIESLKIAHEQKIIKFINQPIKEDLDFEKVYKYSLKLDENKVVPFVTQVIQFIKTKEGLNLEKDQIEEFDQLLLDMQNPEFVEELKYLIANNTYNIWINSDGYPIKIESKTTIVPHPKNQSLANKQFVAELGFLIRDINMPVQIPIPTSYKTFEEIVEQMNSF